MLFRSPSHDIADGHDLVSVRLLYRQEKSKEWNSVAMIAVGNDRWKGAFQCTEEGNWLYSVQAYIDHPQSWLHNFRKRLSENNPQEWKVQLQIGVHLLNQIQLQYPKEKTVIQKWIKTLGDSNLELACQTACSEELEFYFQNFPLIENPSNFEGRSGEKLS